jgi:hypothetical protein
MGQLTIRADDDLIFRVRSKAKESGRSMNEYIVVVLDAATNPASATTERQRLRERLARAGLLVTDDPPFRGQRPDPAAIEAAGREAARGKPLSDYVREDRDEGP